jgi:hypothetical protein
MSPDRFALWKFKTIEGILQGWCPGDFTRSKYERDGKLRATIEYDPKQETAAVSVDGSSPVQVPFRGLVGKLKELGLYVQRDRKFCHENALIPFC